jgi:hypothetical protein
LLDQPIPVLGNLTPRAAARTSKGRTKVVNWIKMIENHASKQAGSNNPIATMTSAGCGRNFMSVN